jgi:DnaJ-class molecular chaperone
MGLSMHGAGTGYNDNVKTCALCHGSGAAFDLRVAHGL